MDPVVLCIKCGDNISFDPRISLSDNGMDFPSPAAEQPIYRSIVDARQKLVELEQSIDNIDRLRRELCSRRREVSAFIDQQALILAPVRKIPKEVFGVIFSHLSPTKIGKTMKFSTRGDDWPAMWIVRQVCKSWHDISLKNKSLWRNVHIAVDGYIHINMNAIKAVLSQSGEAELDLTLALKSGSNDIDTHLTARKNLTEILEDNAHRIQSLAIEPYIAKSIQTPTELPVLESLSFINVGRRSSYEFLLFDHCPRLRRVSNFVNRALRTIGLPWQSLEDLSLEISSNEDIELVCSSCPKLKVFAISVLDTYYEDRQRLDGQIQDPQDDIYFPLLEYLVIHWKTASPLCPSLARLKLPSLRSLECKADSFIVPIGKPASDMWPFEPFKALLSRVSGSLETLRLFHIDVYLDTEIMDLIFLLPGLRQFSFYKNNSIPPKQDRKDPIFQFLDMAPRNRILSFDNLLSSLPRDILSKLEVLTLRCDVLIFSEAVLQGLEARCYHNNIDGGSGHLREINLDFSSVEFPGDARDRLELMRRAGLQICINGLYINW